MLEHDTKILQEKRNVPESAFKLHYPDVHNRVWETAKQLNITRWNEAKYIYTNQIKELPGCKICGKPVRFVSVNKGYKSTCCRECDLTLKSIRGKDAKKTKCNAD